MKVDIEALPITIKYVGQTKDESGWEHFLYRVKIGKKMEIDYKCGLGHVVKPKIQTWPFADPKPKPPTKSDIMYSLVQEMEACDMSFNEWANNYGYDNDSIRALNIYQLCCKQGGDLRREFTREELASIEEQLQDY